MRIEWAFLEELAFEERRPNLTKFIGKFDSRTAVTPVVFKSLVVLNTSIRSVFLLLPSAVTVGCVTQRLYSNTNRGMIVVSRSRLVCLRFCSAS